MDVADPKEDPTRKKHLFFFQIGNISCKTKEKKKHRSIPVMPRFIIRSTSSELNNALFSSASIKFKEKDPFAWKEIPSTAEYTFPFYNRHK
jgi:hypothetical protein